MAIDENFDGEGLPTGNASQRSYLSILAEIPDKKELRKVEVALGHALDYSSGFDDRDRED